MAGQRSCSAPAGSEPSEVSLGQPAVLLTDLGVLAGGEPMAPPAYSVTGTVFSVVPLAPVVYASKNFVCHSFHGVQQSARLDVFTQLRILTQDSHYIFFHGYNL